MKFICEPVAIGHRGEGLPVTIDLSVSARSQLADVELVIVKDYYSSFRRPHVPPFKTTAGEYLGSFGAGLDKSFLCPEMPLPSHLASMVSLGAQCDTFWGKQAIAMVHAGRAGCIAPVHFDWDHSWVAHVCLTGRKRFFFFPPKSGWLLSPIINTSALCIPRFSDPDRRALIHRLDGLEIVLEAGQGILFPSFVWHGVLYEEASLSLSVRFERHLGGRPFRALPRSWWLQRLVARFFDQSYGPEAFEFLTRYLERFFFMKSGWKARYRIINDLCRRTLLEYGEEEGATEFVGENFSAEIVLAGEALRFYYGDACKVSASSDDGRILRACEYLFEGIDRPPDNDLQLAAYALRVKQGLAPQRGLIGIKEV